MYQAEADEMSRQDRQKAKRRRAELQGQVIKDLAELATVEFELPAEPTPAPEPTVNTATHTLAPFIITKDLSGNLRWLAVVSNNYRDRDNPAQIITEDAHKEFVAHLDSHPQDLPTLWHWHTPNTAWGQTDFADYTNGFLVMSGTIDKGHESEAATIDTLGKDIGVSHGFKVLGLDPTHQHITQYRTFEVSPLPASRAANEWTNFTSITKEVQTMLTPEKRQHLTKLLGAERVAALESGTADAKALLDEIGIESKERAAAAEAVQEKTTVNTPTEARNAFGNMREEGRYDENFSNPKKGKPKKKKELGDDEYKADGDMPMDAAASDAPAAETQDEEDTEMSAMDEVNNKLDSILEAIAALSDNAAAQGKAIKALKSSQDEQIADLLAPRARPAQGYRASAARETVIKEASPAPNESAQWWFDSVVAPMVGGR